VDMKPVGHPSSAREEVDEGQRGFLVIVECHKDLPGEHYKYRQGSNQSRVHPSR
jgi:hypothetical protein